MLKLLLFFLIAIYSDVSQAAQYEEGWRWRNSFKDFHELVNIDTPHQALNDYEHGLSLKLIQEATKNIATGAIGIAYKVIDQWGQEKSYGYKVDYIREIKIDGTLGQVCAFVSGYNTRFAGNGFKNGVASHQVSLGKQFLIINGDHFPVTDLYDNLGSYFSEESAAARKFIGDDVLRLIQDDLHSADFARFFSHSEQWLLQYLSKCDSNNNPYVLEANINNIIAQISAEEEKDGKKIEIVRVILHVHTNRDACWRCSSTLSVFSRQLQQLLRMIRRRPGFGFTPLVLVSSRTNYHERRFLAGHDGFYDKEIDIFGGKNGIYSYYKAFVNWPRNYSGSRLK